MRWYWLIPAILIILTAVVWNVPAAKFSETLPAVVTISEPGQIGVYTTREPQKMFNFGSTFPGTKVQKTMNLTNGNEPPARVHITVSGAILSWTSVNRNDFVLDGSAQVEVTVTIPNNAEKGTYNGNITIDYISTYGLNAIHTFRQLLK
ncbi:MAG: hypothetical protein O8C64_16210 [Candidatus Methanoperedens sp.]|nr:hypothetical protein [Candidatus Methanoperedens sp.]MCZ7404803.1 hypothetical protein [Candidatus Methanoperedens sp.]